MNTRVRRADERARATHTVCVAQVTEIQDLANALVAELTKPVTGKTLRVDWRWE